MSASATPTSEPRKKLGGPPRTLPPRSPELAALARAIESLMGDGDRLRSLAKRAGLRERQVSEYVRGRGNPTFTTLLKLADGLGVPLHVLILRARELQVQNQGKHDAA